MVVNIEINDDLMQEVLKLSDCCTQQSVVEAALQEYVQQRKRLKVIELFGSIEYEDDYAYKKQRLQP